MQHLLKQKEVRLFIFLGGFFITNALLAELIGGKLFSVEKIFGLPPVNWSLFGQDNLSFTMTCGVLLWPVVFIMTDIINEYFGFQGVRFLSYLTVGLIAFAFVAISLAIKVPPADFYSISMQPKGIDDMNVAFSAVFGQGLWIIAGSIIAFLVGQMVDVWVFQAIRKRTGSKHLWFRATGSTMVSQLIDSFLVLIIAFYFSGKYPLTWVMAVGVVNFCYKALVAILLTPVLYFVHYAIDYYLGDDLSTSLQNQASQSNEIP